MCVFPHMADQCGRGGYKRSKEMQRLFNMTVSSVAQTWRTSLHKYTNRLMPSHPTSTLLQALIRQDSYPRAIHVRLWTTTWPPPRPATASSSTAQQRCTRSRTSSLLSRSLGGEPVSSPTLACALTTCSPMTASACKFIYGTKVSMTAVLISAYVTDSIPSSLTR